MGEFESSSINDLACKWWSIFCKEEKPEKPELVSGKEQGPSELVPICSGYVDVFTFSEFSGREEEIIRALREADCIDRNGEITLNFESRREAFHDLISLSEQEEEKIFVYLKQIQLEALDPLKYHQCLVERNEKLARRREVNQTRDEVEAIDDQLSLFDLYEGNFPSSDDALQKAREFIFEAARGANNQTDNDLLLKAAGKCLFVYYHYKSAEKEEANKYLFLARAFLESALANKNENIGNDIYKFLDENGDFCIQKIWEEDNIPFVEGYFELKIALYEVLSFIDPVKAADLANELKRELASIRIVTAQGSNLTSAQGYINRLKMLELGQDIYKREFNPDRALETAREIDHWAREQEKTGRVHKAEYGFNRKDLVHDSLRAKLLIGKIYLRQEKYSEAVAAFGEALSAPESTRRYGGFLDIGIEALTYLVYIAVVTSSSRKEAAQKLSHYINWKKIDQNPDFKEALGLMVKAEEKGWLENLSELTKAKPASMSEIRGYLALEFDLPWVLPHPQMEVLSEIPLFKFDPQGKMDLLLSSLALSNVDGYMYARIHNIWRSFEFAEASSAPRAKEQLLDVGFTAPDLRPVLDRQKIKNLLKKEKLDLKTLEAVIKALSEKPGLLAAAEIYKIAPEFFLYFTDVREYWNNASLLLSIYTEEVSRQGFEDNEDIEAVKTLADQMLERLERALKKEKEKPLEEQKIHEQDLIYSLARIQSCRADLIAQFNNSEDRVYEEGVEIALLAIEGFKSVKPEGPYSSKPDYFSIGKTILTLGDLKVRLKEHKAAEQCFGSITEAGIKFNFSRHPISSPNRLLQKLYEFLSPSMFISIEVSSDEIDEALEYNYSRNHITGKEKERSKKSFNDFLLPLSEIKTAGIYLSLNKVKEAKAILERVSSKIERVIVESKNKKADEDEDNPYEYIVPLFVGTYAATAAIYPLSEVHELKKEIEKIDQLLPVLDKLIAEKKMRADSYVLAFLYASKGEVYRALAANAVREEEISLYLAEAERCYEKIPPKHRSLYIEGIIKRVEGFVLASSQEIPHSLTPELALQELARAKDLLKLTHSKPDYYFYQIRLLQARILTSLMKWYEDQGLEPTYDQIMNILEDNIEESDLIAKFAEDSQSAFLAGKSVEVDDPLTEQEELDKILYLTAYNLFSHISQEEPYLYASAVVERNLLIAQHPNAIEHYELDTEELDFAIRFATDQYQNYMLASALDAKAEALLVLADDQLLEAKNPAEREQALKLAREARALLKEAQYDVEPEKELYAKLGILSASILSRYMDEVDAAELQEALLLLEGYQQYFEGDEYMRALAEFLQGELRIGLADKTKDTKTADKYLKEAAAYLALDGVPEKYRDLHAQAAVLRGTLIAREPDFAKVEKVEQAIDDIRFSLYRFKYGSHYSAIGNATLGKLYAILASKVKFGHVSKKCASYEAGLETAVEYLEIAKEEAEFSLAQFEEGKAYVYYSVLADYSEVLLNLYFEKKKTSLEKALPLLNAIEEMALKVKSDKFADLSNLKAKLVLANIYEEIASTNYFLAAKYGLGQSAISAPFKSVPLVNLATVYNDQFGIKMYEKAYALYQEVVKTVDAKGYSLAFENIANRVALNSPTAYTLPSYYRYLRALASIRLAGTFAAWPREKSIAEIEEHRHLVQKGKEELAAVEYNKIENSGLSFSAADIFDSGLEVLLLLEADKPVIMLAMLIDKDLELAIVDREVAALAKEPVAYTFSKDQFTGSFSMQELAKIIGAAPTEAGLNAKLENTQFCSALVNQFRGELFLKKIKLYAQKAAALARLRRAANNAEGRKLPVLTAEQRKVFEDYEKITALTRLINTTERYRGRDFSSLTAEQKQNVVQLNRLLLEYAYPEVCPKTVSLTEKIEAKLTPALTSAKELYDRIATDKTIPDYILYAVKTKQLEMIIRNSKGNEKNKFDYYQVDARGYPKTDLADQLIKEYEAFVQTLPPQSYYRYQIYLYLATLYLYRDAPGDLQKMERLGREVQKYARGLNHVSGTYMETYGRLYELTAIFLQGIKESNKGKEQVKKSGRRDLSLLKSGMLKVTSVEEPLKEIEKSIPRLAKEYQEKLLWDLDSLRAELYHQQAVLYSFREEFELLKYGDNYAKIPKNIVGKFYGNLQKAYLACRKSRSLYDRTKRPERLMVYYPTIPSAFADELYPREEYLQNEYKDIFMRVIDFAFFLQDVADQKPVRSGWQYWKERFIDQSSYLVKDLDPHSQANQNKTFTERTGYGMFFATALGDIETALKLFAAMEEFSLNKKGLFAWELDRYGNKLREETEGIPASSNLSDFYKHEFTGLINAAVKALCRQDPDLAKVLCPEKEFSTQGLYQAIAADDYGITFNPRDTELEKLNAVLRTPSLYELCVSKGKRIELTPDLERLEQETRDARGRNFNDLDDAERENIMRFNRLVLEAAYPDQCPKMRVIDYSALDADLYMAYALIKIGTPQSQARAQEIIDRIWKYEVSSRGGRLMLEPSDGSWRKRGDGAIIFNPSYFAPYLLKTIAEFDQKSCGKDRPSKQKPHDWQKLIDDQYELMSAILATKGLRHPEAKGTNPMPDWAVCSVIAGDFKCESYLLQTTYPEMDAIRVMIEIGHDAIINKDPRAIKFLREFLIKSGFYKKDGITPVDNFISRVKIGGDDKNKILAIAVYAVAIKGSGDPAAAANLETFKKALDEAFTVHPEDPDKGYFGNATDADQYYKQSLILMCRMLLGEK